MRIGLIDVDGHNFPNLPLMKISAYHKTRGDDVSWFDPLFGGHYDIVYGSKVFNFTGDYPYFIDADEIIFGGSGYQIAEKDGREIWLQGAENLPYEIEHTTPDYGLYGIEDTAYGYLTRGCGNDCGFCHVTQKEGMQVFLASPLSEFWHGQKNIVLMDPNMLGVGKEVSLRLLDELMKTGAYIDFTQGLDIRLLDDDLIDRILQMKIKKIHFAWDDAKDWSIPERLYHFRERSGYGRDKVSVYLLTNYDTRKAEDLMRIETVREIGFRPYVMIYQKDKLEPGHILRKMQRWCNSFIFYTVKEFDQYMGGNI